MAGNAKPVGAKDLLRDSLKHRVDEERQLLKGLNLNELKLPSGNE